MITTIDLTAPVGNATPGTVTITVDIESDNEGPAFSDSFQLWINDVKATFTSAEAGGTWTLTATPYLMGNQIVKVYAQATDVDEKKGQHFAFTVDPEAWFGARAEKHAHIIDEFAAYLPPFMKARGDRYSVFRQLFNPIAKKYDETREKLHLRSKALDPDQAALDDPDWLYQYTLGTNEEFSTRVDSSGYLINDVPEVWGIHGFNRVALAATDSFRNLWREALPARFLSTDAGVANTQITGSYSIHDLATIKNLDVPVPGVIYIWAHSVTNAVKVTNDEFTSVDILIKGQAPEGLEQEELISVLRSEVLQTQKPWGKIERVRLVSAPDDATAEIALLNFTPRISTKVDPLIQRDGEELIQWEIGFDSTGTYIDRQSSGQGFVLDLARGEDTFHTNERLRLLNSSAADVTLTDFSIDPTSFYVWGVDATRLYVWDRREDLPTNMSYLTGSSKSPEVDFHIARYSFSEDTGGGVESTISIELDPARGINPVRRWYWSGVSPSGSSLYLGETNTFDGVAPNWKGNRLPVQYFGIQESDFDITIAGTGSYIVELNIEFMDGSTEVVKKLVNIQALTALAEYKLDHLISGDGVNRVTVRPDGDIFVSSAGSAWRLSPMFDTFMTDYNAQAIFIREKFDQIEVKF